jgi:hypothetical protein
VRDLNSPNAKHQLRFFEGLFAHLVIATGVLHVGNIAKVADFFDLLDIDNRVFAKFAIHDHWASNDLPPFTVFAVLAAQCFINSRNIFGASASPYRLTNERTKKQSGV